MPKGYNWTSKDCLDWRKGWRDTYDGCTSLQDVVKRSRQETNIGMIPVLTKREKAELCKQKNSIDSAEQ